MAAVIKYENLLTYACGALNSERQNNLSFAIRLNVRREWKNEKTNMDGIPETVE